MNGLLKEEMKARFLGERLALQADFADKRAQPTPLFEKTAALYDTTNEGEMAPLPCPKTLPDGPTMPQLNPHCRVG